MLKLLQYQLKYIVLVLAIVITDCAQESKKVTSSSAESALTDIPDGVAIKQIGSQGAQDLLAELSNDSGGLYITSCIDFADLKPAYQREFSKRSAARRFLEVLMSTTRRVYLPLEAGMDEYCAKAEAASLALAKFNQPVTRPSFIPAPNTRNFEGIQKQTLEKLFNKQQDIPDKVTYDNTKVTELSTSWEALTPQGKGEGASLFSPATDITGDHTLTKPQKTWIEENFDEAVLVIDNFNTQRRTPEFRIENLDDLENLFGLALLFKDSIKRKSEKLGAEQKRLDEAHDLDDATPIRDKKLKIDKTLQSIEELQELQSIYESLTGQQLEVEARLDDAVQVVNNSIADVTKEITDQKEQLGAAVNVEREAQEAGAEAAANAAKTAAAAAAAAALDRTAEALQQINTIRTEAAAGAAGTTADLRRYKTLKQVAQESSEQYIEEGAAAAKKKLSNKTQSLVEKVEELSIALKREEELHKQNLANKEAELLEVRTQGIAEGRAAVIAEGRPEGRRKGRTTKILVMGALAIIGLSVALGIIATKKANGSKCPDDSVPTSDGEGCVKKKITVGGGMEPGEHCLPPKSYDNEDYFYDKADGICYYSKVASFDAYGQAQDKTEKIQLRARTAPLIFSSYGNATANLTNILSKNFMTSNKVMAYTSYGHIKAEYSNYGSSVYNTDSVSAGPSYSTSPNYYAFRDGDRANPATYLADTPTVIGDVIDNADGTVYLYAKSLIDTGNTPAPYTIMSPGSWHVSQWLHLKKCESNGSCPSALPLRKYFENDEPCDDIEPYNVGAAKDDLFEVAYCRNKQNGSLVQIYNKDGATNIMDMDSDFAISLELNIAENPRIVRIEPNLDSLDIIFNIPITVDENKFSKITGTTHTSNKCAFVPGQAASECISNTTYNSSSSSSTNPLTLTISDGTTSTTKYQLKTNNATEDHEDYPGIAKNTVLSLIPWDSTAGKATLLPMGTALSLNLSKTNLESILKTKFKDCPGLPADNTAATTSCSNTTPNTYSTTTALYSEKLYFSCTSHCDSYCEGGYKDNETRTCSDSGKQPVDICHLCKTSYPNCGNTLTNIAKCDYSLTYSNQSKVKLDPSCKGRQCSKRDIETTIAGKCKRTSFGRYSLGSITISPLHKYDTYGSGNKMISPYFPSTASNSDRCTKDSDCLVTKLNVSNNLELWPILEVRKIEINTHQYSTNFFINNKNQLMSIFKNTDQKSRPDKNYLELIIKKNDLNNFKDIIQGSTNSCPLPLDKDKDCQNCFYLDDVNRENLNITFIAITTNSKKTCTIKTVRDGNLGPSISDLTDISSATLIGAVFYMKNEKKRKYFEHNDQDGLTDKNNTNISSICTDDTDCQDCLKLCEDDKTQLNAIDIHSPYVKCIYQHDS